MQVQCPSATRGPACSHTSSMLKRAMASTKKVQDSQHCSSPVGQQALRWGAPFVVQVAASLPRCLQTRPRIEHARPMGDTARKAGPEAAAAPGCAPGCVPSATPLAASGNAACSSGRLVQPPWSVIMLKREGVRCPVLPCLTTERWVSGPSSGPFEWPRNRGGGGRCCNVQSCGCMIITLPAQCV